MSIKAVMTDVDGTLTDGRKVMSVRAIEALRAVQANGVPVGIATGNVLPVALGISTYVGLEGPIVAENGGLVSWRKEIYQLFDGRGPEAALRHLESVMPVKRLFTDNWRRTEVALERSMPLDEVREALRGFDVDLEATGFAIHIISKGHGKAAGVRKAAELLGIELSEMAAFGDSDNDAGMLRECGVGVAVGNASPSAKAAADRVASGEGPEGVIEGLKELGLL